MLLYSIYISNCMFKLIKEWYNDYQHAMKELQGSGWYIFYHSHGSVCHYVEPEKTTHINTADDKLDSIRKNDTKS